MNNNRLCFLHSDTCYETRKDLFESIKTNLQYDPEFSSMYAEPIVFKYKGEDDNHPNIVLAIGSVDAKLEEGNKGNYFLIDFAHLEESINDINEKAKLEDEKVDEIKNTVETFIEQYSKDFETLNSGLESEVEARKEADSKLEELIDKLSKILHFDVEETDTVKFTQTKNEDGSFNLSADVKIPETKIVDSKVIDNQLSQDENGVFYRVDLACDKKENTLVLSVNGKETETISLPEGKFIADGRYDKNTEELVLDYNNANEESLRINLRELINEWNVEDERYQTGGVVLSIIERDEVAPGVARNAEEWQDVLHAEIKFDESEDNLAKLNNGGLFVSNKAKDIKYKGEPLNKFLDTLVPYQAFESIIKRVWYDKSTDELCFEFTVNNHESEIIRISVSDFLSNEFGVKNDPTSPIVMEYNHVKEGMSYFSADLKVSNAKNNILSVNEHGELIVNAIAAKVTYGKSTVKDALDALYDADIKIYESIQAEISKVNDSIAEETERAVNAEEKLNESISKAISDVTKAYEDSIANLDSKISAETENHLIGITITQENGKLSSVEVKESDIATNHSVDDKLATKANANEVYTSVQVDKELAKKVDKATTLAGYEIADAYTKTEVDTAITAVKSEILGGVGSDYDTLKELADWINGHRDLYDGLITKISEKAVKSDVDAALALKADTEYVNLELGKVNTELALKVNDVYIKNHYYTKTDTNAELAKKADIATTLVGYGIADAFTKDEVNSIKGDLEKAIESEKTRAEKVDSDLSLEIKKVKSELNGEIAKLKGDIEFLKGALQGLGIITVKYDDLQNGFNVDKENKTVDIALDSNVSDFLKVDDNGIGFTEGSKIDSGLI